MDRDEIVCPCVSLSRGEIVDAIKSYGLKTVEEVGKATTAGTICGACIPDIEEILKEVNGE